MLAPVATTHAASDWDLYMLRLVNRARQNPTAEPGIIGSAVTDPRAAVASLAYQANVGAAATNHNNWMHDNFGNIASSDPPDSFTHYETLNGASNGTPATGTPSYTGVSLGTRITAAGFSWNSAGENITARWSTSTIPVDRARIDAAHKGWWESSGHRNNMLSGNYTVFGFHAESRSFAPPRGGLSSPIDNLHYATQDYARPSSGPYTYVFGLLYDDVDGSGNWTPRDLTHAQHEGLGGVIFDVYTAGTSTRVGGGTTMENGAFSVRLGNGRYDVEFSLPDGVVTVADVVLNGANVDAGDIPAEAEPDELAMFVDCQNGPSRAPAPAVTGLSAQECRARFDYDADGDVDLRDYAAFIAN
jgi:hypothetical protein